MLTVNEITKFINDYENSRKRERAKIGARYYEGEHDIKDYRLYYYNGDGELVEDRTRSNIKIPHPFFTELVDQEVQYLLSNDEAIFKSDEPKLQAELDEYFNNNESFRSELNELVTDTVAKGFGFMYAYKDKNDRLAFQAADSLGVVEVRAKETEDKCDYVIYYYTDRLTKKNKEIRRIQVWDEKETHYYVQSGKGKIELDKDEKINPKPHTLYKKGNDEQLYYEGFGYIPFFRLDNNRKQISGLKPIKELIDDYDLMSCGLSNNLQDASEYLVVVSGFQGDTLDELIQNTKTKKHIGVDAGGTVDFKTVNVPYEARKAKLELDEKNIYKFGMGLNTSQVGDGNITNVVIKSRYALLDLKCNKIATSLKQFFRKLLNAVLKEINERLKTDFQQKDVYFDLTREVMTNASDNAAIELSKAQTEQIKINTLLNLAATLDNETILTSICEVMDISYEDIKDKLPKSPEEEIQALENELEVTNNE